MAVERLGENEPDRSSTLDDAAAEWFRTDQVMLEQFRLGDQSALKALYERHHSGAVAFALRSGATRENAEDIASEAFLNVIDAIGRGKGPTVSMGLYLRSAVHNLMIRHGKEAQRSILVDDMEDLVEPVQFEPEEEDESVVQAFRALPERWQTVLWLREIDKRRTSDVARSMGISPGATTLLHRRARNGLRARYVEALVDSDSYICTDYRSAVAARANGTLRGKARELYERHLLTCISCRRADRNLTNVVARFAAIIPPTALGLFLTQRQTPASALAALAKEPLARLAFGVLAAATVVIAVIVALAGYGQTGSGEAVVLDRTAPRPTQLASEVMPSGTCQLLFAGTETADETAYFEVRNSSTERCRVSYTWNGGELSTLRGVNVREYFFAPRDGQYRVRLVTPSHDEVFTFELR